ncbi:MAG: GAF domain-containing protein [Frankia sp.]
MGQPTGLPPAARPADPPLPAAFMDPRPDGAASPDDLLDLLRRSGVEGEPRSPIRHLLDAVSTTVDEADLGVMLHRIVSAGCALVDADRGALAVEGPDGRPARFVTIGLDPETAAVMGDQVTGRGMPLMEQPSPACPAPAGPGSSRGPRRPGSARPLPPGHPPVTTFLVVPVNAHDRPVGSLYLGDKRTGGPFTADDEATARALAAIAAFAIDNVARYEETRRGQAWLAAGTEITTALLSAESPGEALTLVARRARQVVGADLAAIVVPSPPDPDTLVISVADGTGATALRGVRIAVTGSRYAEILSTGRAELIPAAGGPGAALFGPATDAVRIGPAMVLPLIAAGRCGGALVVGSHPGQPPFAPLDLEMASAFAGQAALALHMARAQRERERLAVFEDRDRIARDLHDVVIQRVFATGLQLSAVVRSVDGEAAEKVTSAIAELDRTMDDIRRAIFSLKAPTGEGSGLSEHIIDIAARTTDSLGVEPDVRLEGPVDLGVPEPVRAHLIAALRETLSNIARHARATRIGVLVRVTHNRVLIEVRDNGCGPGGGSRTSGLANLRRRAADLGGQMEYGPGHDGTGTTVTWWVPIV